MNNSSKKKEIITDPRFSKVHSDVRFAKISRGGKKGTRKTESVVEDDRFARLKLDKDFSTKPIVDKYGVPVEKKSKKNVKEVTESLDSESVSDEDEILEERSENETSSDESSSELSDLDGYIDESDEGEEDIPMGEESSRLSVMNLDWQHVKSIDILALLQSFTPSSGIIKQVSVYQSEYGKEKIAQEQQHGPRSIFKQAKESRNGDSDDDEESEEEGGLDKNQLRKYEKDKLKWYYAVIECDTVATATALYNNVDGTEYQQSGNIVDMRFIPDSIDFTSFTPRDTATSVPADYSPPDFHTLALQHSNVDPTWDEGDPARVALTTKQFTTDEIDQMDFDAYLASSSSESDEEGREARIARYRNLLEGDEEKEDNTDSEDEQGDIEISFVPGLSQHAAETVDRKRKEKAGESETVWEKYQRERKEKRKTKRADEKERVINDDFFAVDGGEEKVGKKGRNEEKGEEEEKAKQAAELELLLMQEGADQKKLGKGYNLKDLMDRTKKGKKGKKSKAKAKETDDFKMDVKDSRFDAMFNKAEFAVDPTATSFKRTEGMEAILKERQQRAEVKASKGVSSAGSKKGRSVLDIAESLKRKSKSRDEKQKKRTKRS